MKNILQTIFLSSEGNGSISLFWKSILVALLAHYAPNANMNDITTLVSTLVQVVSGVVAFYGIVRKIFNDRWSAVPK